MTTSSEKPTATEKSIPPLTIADILSSRGYVSASAMERVSRLCEQSGRRFDKVALTLGLLSEADLAAAYAELLSCPLVTRDQIPTHSLAFPSLAIRFLRHARVLPIAVTVEELRVAMVDPFDESAINALNFSTGLNVVAMPIAPSEFEAAMVRLYPKEEPGANVFDVSMDEIGESDLQRLKDLASDAPVIRVVNQLIQKAVECQASDIHIEATEGGMRLRYRIDGVLREIGSPQSTMRAAIVSRIKIMANLDIAERRIAQDGRIRLPIRGREIDFRVSTTPSVHGESVVLRVLDKGNLKLEFEALGFDTKVKDTFLDVLSRPYGILLVTGPTGSGKTTTLYTALSHLNSSTTKILTVEDPVEYLLPGVNQVQVKPQIGLTFASALRSFLRQDPDIMMIGEIRDLETAQIAVQAALTGHIVLSTVHTNDAASAITRLLDMGLEDYLLTSTINGIAAQRLVRTLCHKCKIPTPASPSLFAPIGGPIRRWGGDEVIYKAAGCEMCGFTGYHGRTMIVEVLRMSEPMRRLVLKHAEADELRKLAVEEGMHSMYRHGLDKVMAGITTFEELTRAVREM